METLSFFIKVCTDAENKLGIFCCNHYAVHEKSNTKGKLCHIYGTEIPEVKLENLSFLCRLFPPNRHACPPRHLVNSANGKPREIRLAQGIERGNESIQKKLMKL